MNYQSVLFDLDGTLLDTSEGIKESVLHVVHKLGLPTISDNHLDQFVGPPIQKSISDYFGLSFEESQLAADIFRDYYKENALFKAHIYGGIVDVLESLVGNGIKIGVATYKREDYAVSILEHFGISKFCSTIHGADNFNKLTKQDIIGRCIQNIRTPFNKTVMVGDTKYDAKGAMDAGVPFIGVTWGFGKEADFVSDEYPIIAIATQPSELKNILL